MERGTVEQHGTPWNRATFCFPSALLFLPPSSLPLPSLPPLWSLFTCNCARKGPSVRRSNLGPRPLSRFGNVFLHESGAGDFGPVKIFLKVERAEKRTVSKREREPYLEGSIFCKELTFIASKVRPCLRLVTLHSKEKNVERHSRTI